jgi:hypothetical protein
LPLGGSRLTSSVRQQIVGATQYLKFLILTLLLKWLWRFIQGLKVHSELTVSARPKMRPALRHRLA